MTHLKIIDFESKRPKPSHLEAKKRLDNFFQDFVTRGASPKETASLIFTYGVCELLSYAETPNEGSEVIDEVLYNCFGIKKDLDVLFTGSFVKDDEPEWQNYWLESLTAQGFGVLSVLSGFWSKW